MKRTADLLVAGALAAAAAAVASCGRGNTGTGESCQHTRECIPSDICWYDLCVGDGALRVSLRWEAVSDFDMHLLTPNGEELYYYNRMADGGNFDVDDCTSEGCINPSGWHVESVVFADAAPPGLYSVWVVNYTGALGGDFTIETSTGNSFVGALPAVAGAVSDVYDFVF